MLTVSELIDQRYDMHFVLEQPKLNQAHLDAGHNVDFLGCEECKPAIDAALNHPDGSLVCKRCGMHVFSCTKHAVNVHGDTDVVIPEMPVKTTSDGRRVTTDDNGQRVYLPA